MTDRHDDFFFKSCTIAIKPGVCYQMAISTCWLVGFFVDQKKVAKDSADTGPLVRFQSANP